MNPATPTPISLPYRESVTSWAKFGNATDSLRTIQAITKLVRESLEAGEEAVWTPEQLLDWIQVEAQRAIDHIDPMK